MATRLLARLLPTPLALARPMQVPWIPPQKERVLFVQNQASAGSAIPDRPDVFDRSGKVPIEPTRSYYFASSYSRPEGINIKQTGIALVDPVAHSIDNSLLADLHSGPLVIQPNQTIHRFLDCLPRDFSGKLFFKTNEERALQVELGKVSEEPDEYPIKLEVDHRGTRYFYFKSSDDWVSMDPAKWNGPLHLSPEQSAVAITRSVSSTLLHGSLCYDPALIPERHFNQIIRDGKVCVIEGITPKAIEHLIHFCQLYEEFIKAQYKDHFVEIEALACSKHDEFVDIGLGLAYFSRRLSLLGIKESRIKQGSDGRIIARSENLFIKSERLGEEDGFRIKMKQILPGIFEISVRNNNGDWIEINPSAYDSGAPGVSAVPSRSVLDNIFSLNLDVESESSAQDTADRNKRQLVSMAWVFDDYEDLQDKSPRLVGWPLAQQVELLLEFVKRHRALSCALYETPYVGEDLPLQFLSAVMKIYESLFGHPDVESYFLNYAMLVYATEYISKNLSNLWIESPSTNLETVAKEFEHVASLSTPVFLLVRSRAILIKDLRDFVRSQMRDKSLKENPRELEKNIVQFVQALIIRQVALAYNPSYKF